MRSRMLQRLALAAIVGTGIGVCVTPRADARPVRPGPQASRRGFDLFQGAKTVLMNVNRIECNLIDRGKVCNNPLGGGSLEDGIWPKGSADNYIYNGGLQLGAIVTSATPFTWVGDTVGVYFMDPRGNQEMGEGLTNIFTSSNKDDLDNWPDDAIIRDASLYDASLIDRQFISQQDAWVRYWDGNASLGSGRKHPMGVMVEQRALAWNFPSGNEDVLYVLFRFVNITASDPTVYDTSSSLIAAGYTAGQRAEIGGVGTRFANSMNQLYNITIPAEGFTFHNMFAAFFQDADVAGATANFSTTSLPFAMSYAYEADWLGLAGFSYPPDIFGAPFAAVTGLEGVKYLKSPINPATGQEFGISMWSNTNNPNSGGFIDPSGVSQMYRYISATISPAFGDGACNSANPPVQRYCNAVQTAADTRFFMSSGPFDLGPGQTSVIVVAIVFAAPVASLPADATGPVALPAFSLAPYVGNVNGMPPGFPTLPDRLASGLDTVRTIERVAGWKAYKDVNGDGSIEQDEVTTLPRSLLNKSLVAQAVFNSKFLLPFAPDAPQFYLVPGDGQVTVVWQKSTTENPTTGGDPYFKVASDVTNALYDPNYRKFDVEGYRVWRGRTASDMRVIAQFDYAGTTFTDYTGQVFDPTNPNCAPELGLGTAADCGVDFTYPYVGTGNSKDYDISGDLIQVPPGGRTLLASGNIIVVKADTAITGGASGYPAPTDNGVPFTYVDNTVQNGFTYYYAVTAFDVNSATSGPSSLQSGLVPNHVLPRASAPNEVDAVLSFGLYGDDTTKLDPSKTWKIDGATGRFIGTPPPTDALSAVFQPLVPQLLPALSLTATIDSLVATSLSTDASAGCAADFNGLGACYTAYLTFDRDGVLTKFVVPVFYPFWASFDALSNTAGLGALQVAADSVAVGRYGIPTGFSTFNAAVGATLYEAIMNSNAEGHSSRRLLGGVSPGGSRWFEGADETLDHPTYSIRLGHLAGVDSIWAPIHHTDTDPLTAGNQTYANSTLMQCFPYIAAPLGREADVQFTWGSGGTIASVRDITHHVDVAFDPHPEATYGFVGDANGDGVIDWDDFNFLEEVSQFNDDNIGQLGFCNHTDPGDGNRYQLRQNPVIGPVSTNQAQVGAPQTGTGFGLYVNGERFIFQLTGGTPPASGTVWTLRTYAGLVRASSGGATTTPSGYSFSAVPRPPLIPGLKVVFSVPARTDTRALTAADLKNVHTVPDPYYVTNELENAETNKILRFVNLPPRAIIRIYSASGILVRIITHNDAALGSEAVWDLRNRNNQYVASGVYFYHVETPEGLTKIGRFTVVNFAQ
jgi:hypothetical protein